MPVSRAYNSGLWIVHSARGGRRTQQPAKFDILVPQAIAETGTTVVRVGGGGQQATALGGAVPCSEDDGLTSVLEQLTITGRPKRVPGGNPMDVILPPPPLFSLPPLVQDSSHPLQPSNQGRTFINVTFDFGPGYLSPSYLSEYHAPFQPWKDWL